MKYVPTKYPNFCTGLHGVTPHETEDSRPLQDLKSDVPYFLAHKTHFFLEKCELNSTCVLCTEGKYYFQTYKYLYIYYTTSLSWDRENSHEDDFSGSDDDFLGFYD